MTKKSGSVCLRQSYLSRIPSASIVNKIENLLRTVNIGRLVEENINHYSKLSRIKLKLGKNTDSHAW